jgi:uncharacterized membrane protein
MDKNRFWEVDSLRGAAVIMMIIFHLLFDLNFFSLQPVNVYSGFWWLFARITASLFILLAGISLTLSYSRVSQEPKSFLRRKYLIRGAKIFSFGMIITLLTQALLPQGTIFFGILHFIGLSIPLGYLFLRFKKLNLLLAIVFIIVGLFLDTLNAATPWFLWLGLRPSLFYTLDYFPLFPWFSLILIGIFLGKTLYPEGRSPLRERNPKPLPFLGRNSLLIYLIHQPVLIAILYLLVM